MTKYFALLALPWLYDYWASRVTIARRFMYERRISSTRSDA